MHLSMLYNYLVMSSAFLLLGWTIVLIVACILVFR